MGCLRARCSAAVSVLSSHSGRSGRDGPVCARVAKLSTVARDRGLLENALFAEPSPYLRQHAFNPVRWLPWGGVAFARALEEDKPLLVSVGYSTCHWCHIMNSESFEDPGVAAVLDASFVSVKVDRETRPDVDKALMAYLQATAGRGGWPLTVITTPLGRPFYAATYLSQPALLAVLTRVMQLWGDPAERKEVEEAAGKSADALVARARSSTALAPVLPADFPSLSSTALDTTSRSLLRRFDSSFGGFSGPAPPKFPRPTELALLLTYGEVVAAAHVPPPPHPPPPPAAVTSASVPFMITRGMRADLARRGWSTDDVRSMTPATAHVVLSLGEGEDGAAYTADELRAAGSDTAQTGLSGAALQCILTLRDEKGLGKARVLAMTREERAAAALAASGAPAGAVQGGAASRPSPTPASPLPLATLAGRIAATRLLHGTRLDLGGLVEPRGALPDGRRSTVSPGPAALAAWYTLRRVLAGGLWDALGGGVHRYATDAAWCVPNFEKTAADQAALCDSLCVAYTVTGDPSLASAAQGSVAYVLRDLSVQPEGEGDSDFGGVFSAEAAGSGGWAGRVRVPAPWVGQQSLGAQAGGRQTGEGAFYTWTAGDVRSCLSNPTTSPPPPPGFTREEVTSLALHHWRVQEGGVPGNTGSREKTDPRGDLLSVLSQAGDVRATVEAQGQWARRGLLLRQSTFTDFAAALAWARGTLQRERAAVRPRPHRDEKVVTVWNGSMLASFARAALTVSVPAVLRQEWGVSPLTCAPEVAALLQGERGVDDQAEILAAVEGQHEAGGWGAPAGAAPAAPLSHALSSHAFCLSAAERIALYAWRHLVDWRVRAAGGGEATTSTHALAHPSAVFDAEGTRAPWRFNADPGNEPGTRLLRSFLPRDVLGAVQPSLVGAGMGTAELHGGSAAPSPPIPAFLDDYATLIHGLLALYQAGGPGYGWALGWARALQARLDGSEGWWVEDTPAPSGEPESGESGQTDVSAAAAVDGVAQNNDVGRVRSGAYAFTPMLCGEEGAGLWLDVLMRDVPDKDGAEPCPNSTALSNLTALGALTHGGDTEVSEAYIRRATALATRFAARLGGAGPGLAPPPPSMVVAVDALRAWHDESFTVVEVTWPTGGGGAERGVASSATALLLAAHARHNHARVVMHTAVEEGGDQATAATLRVRRGTAWGAPVTDLSAAVAESAYRPAQ